MDEEANITSEIIEIPKESEVPETSETFSKNNTDKKRSKKKKQVKYFNLPLSVSRIDEVITALACNPHGIPTTAIKFIGNGSEIQYKQIISILNSDKYTYKDAQSGLTLTTPITVRANTGKFKVIRLKVAGEKALEQINPEAYRKYKEEKTYRVSDKLGIMREQSYSECYLFLQSSGYETRKYIIPDINKEPIYNKIQKSGRPHYYASKTIKKLYDNKQRTEETITKSKGGINKTLYSRCKGMIFYPDDRVYPIYNCQGGMLGIEKSENRNKYSMLNVAMNNGYNIGGLTSCILIGYDYESCIETLLKLEKKQFEKLQIDNKTKGSTNNTDYISYININSAGYLLTGYEHTYCVPMTNYGQNLLRIYAEENWKDRLYNVLLGENRSDGTSYATDGKVNGKNIILAIDSDFNRLLKIANRVRRGELKDTMIYCFNEEKDILFKLFGQNKENVEFATLGNGSDTELITKLISKMRSLQAQ